MVISGTLGILTSKLEISILFPPTVLHHSSIPAASFFFFFFNISNDLDSSEEHFRENSVQAKRKGKFSLFFKKNKQLLPDLRFMHSLKAVAHQFSMAVAHYKVKISS